MNFLYPGFLFALAAIIIPVIIHLYSFRKFKRVYFSNVRFLKTVEQQTSSRQKIKNRLILASRILAILFLVLAFAKPYIADKSSANAFRSALVSVYIDNSYSMQAVSKEGVLLDEAKRRAREIVSAYSLNDRFQLITNDFEGKHQRLMGREDFLNAVDEVRISSNTSTLRQVVNRQSELLASEPMSDKTIYLVSDFQRNILGSSPVSTDSGISIVPVKLKANVLPNVSVDSVWFTSPVHRPGITEQLVVKLKNNSDEKARRIPVKLIINNQQKAIASLSVAPRAAAVDTLTFGRLQAGWEAAEISINDYPMIFDDRFFFSFKVRPELQILSINGNAPSTYLQAVYSSDPFFRLENVPAGNVNYSRLASYSMVILNSVENLPAGLAEQLTTYVRNGGSLIVFPALTGSQSGLTALLQNLNTDIPAGVGDAPAKVASLNLKHPVFNGVFERIPARPDLPEVKTYVEYTVRSNTNRRSILDFPGRRTFFSEYLSGRGKVYLCAVPLDENVSNLVRHSLFVPLMYQTALLSLKDQKIFHTLGVDNQVIIDKVSLNPNETLKLQAKGFEAIPDVRQMEGFSSVYLADQVRNSGNYNLKKGDSLLAVVAYNDNRAESDLSYAADKEIAAQFPGKKAEILKPASGSLQNAIRAANYGTRLWKLCIILALLFLAAEVLLVRFYNKFPSKTINT